MAAGMGKDLDFVLNFMFVCAAWKSRWWVGYDDGESTFCCRHVDTVLHTSLYLNKHSVWIDKPIHMLHFNINLVV